MTQSNVFDTEILTAIEQQLDHLLTRPAQPAAAGLERIYAAMRYSALAGGKRLRPYLTVLAADLFDVPRSQSIRAGSAIELIHCYSLIHDDLPAMDDSDLRRGRATSHIEFDDATAVLAGDALLTEAFAVLADAATHPVPEVRTILVSQLAMAAGPMGMVGGQMMDIMAETGMAAAEDIALIQSLKTGALIAVSCRFGAYLAQAGQPETDALQRFAADIGLAFQITDDLLDVSGSAAQTGKPTGQDAMNSKPTFVDLLGETGAREKAATLIEDAKQALAVFSPRQEPLARIADFILSRQS
ncbi:polyprenyl synthetase family protein [Parvularcula sp. IMCC14364]|uniref:polyprenyl synthetase family protein n=1 Tax=Parvularcula sp. IMCC14364 TaxID=3067902 RepID=UPI002740BBD5|nr:farnesyl diphosphate synthase [Parvularcula sp. IMCC14364]